MLIFVGIASGYAALGCGIGFKLCVHAANPTYDSGDSIPLSILSLNQLVG